MGNPETSEATELISVIAEQIQIEKRVVQTGQVRLVKTVHEAQQVVDVPLAINPNVPIRPAWTRRVGRRYKSV